MPLKEGGIIGLQNNLLNKEWKEMCGAAYKPSAVTDEPKYMGPRQQGKCLLLEGGLDRNGA